MKTVNIYYIFDASVKIRGNAQHRIEENITRISRPCLLRQASRENRGIRQPRLRRRSQNARKRARLRQKIRTLKGSLGLHLAYIGRSARRLEIGARKALQKPRIRIWSKVCRTARNTG